MPRCSTRIAAHCPFSNLSWYGCVSAPVLVGTIGLPGSSVFVSCLICTAVFGVAGEDPPCESSESLAGIAAYTAGRLKAAMPATTVQAQRRIMAECSFGYDGHNWAAAF